jgi:hypothetical protein
MKKKLLFISSITLILFFLLNLIYLKFNNDEIKKLLPNNVKLFLKKTIFIVPYLKKDLESSKLLTEKQIAYTNLLKNELIKIQQSRGIVNEKIFPDTQFNKFNYSEIQVKGILSKKGYKRDGETVSPFYIETFQNNLLIASKDLKIYYSKIDNILNNNLDQKILPVKISKQKIELTDILIIKNFLYIAIHNKKKKCNNLTVLRAKINFDKLVFEDFFESGSKGNCDVDAIAGKIQPYTHENKDGLLIMTRNEEDKNYFLNDQYGSKLEYKFSTLIFIDFNNRQKTVFASGFRNPQGLLVTSDDYIISTEHGPRGGDEINRIQYGKNYGWPMASYGENYYKSLDENYDHEYLKSHKEFGFEEPIYSFVPSIGITEIIEINENFSKKWGKTFLIASLRAGSLFRIIFDDQYYKVISMEQIRLRKRIRDIKYDKNSKTIFLAMENKKGVLGVMRLRD